MLKDKIISNGFIDLSIIGQYYPWDYNSNVKVFFIINRIYNDFGREISISFNNPFESEMVRLEDEIKGKLVLSEECYLDLVNIVENYHIPRNYTIELFIQFISHDNKIKQVFPGEIKRDAMSLITDLPDNKIYEFLFPFQEDELYFKLKNIGYGEIANDLKEATIRLEKNDHEGAIKFFRKVIEGFRHLNIKEIIQEKNRSEKIQKFLNISFDLLSNFGEHTGTIASIEEANLSHKIAFGISEYFLAKSIQ